MIINLDIIPLEKKEDLRVMLKKYEQELTGLADPSEYKYLDSYWLKETRHPYFIKVDGEVAGFALVNQHCLVQDGGHNLAEFYVIPAFRKQGVGRTAAFQVFNLFCGNWELRELADNSRARVFWTNVLKDYTQNNFQETVLDTDNWHGPVQTFTTDYVKYDGLS
ncbi:MAG: GCN5-related N-acetyltransferase [Candidatus Woesebacteria bacterium GW2011_GWA2_40_7]|uniref:GCN5-related N-acetyltransferase n=2 Tax=Candidatus Woeseibacteriota TaxID=1752722 RepID=A0A0G0UQD5_9BACT|nr:MAG: GCN5-related N-acetyltransferase [Candidatus Woesebacteria bacterium GW2011_GWA2_40_7]KKR90994.1 MAG: GCN5-related N-acetyltransferase [Candidatus Woesebacteria bacterium GW2011_GWA1_41_13b]